MIWSTTGICLSKLVCTYSSSDSLSLFFICFLFPSTLLLFVFGFKIMLRKPFAWFGGSSIFIGSIDVVPYLYQLLLWFPYPNLAIQYATLITLSLTITSSLLPNYLDLKIMGNVRMSQELSVKSPSTLNLLMPFHNNILLSSNSAMHASRSINRVGSTQI